MKPTWGVRIRRSNDVRVLKTQLDALASVVTSSRYLAPVWAAWVAFFASDTFGFFGHRPIFKSAALPALIAALMLLCQGFIEHYREAADSATADELRQWFRRFIGVQLLISLAWGCLPWLLWDPTSMMNHVFVWAAVVCVVASFVVNRANHLDMLAASLAPIVALTLLRLLVGHTEFDYGLAALLPFCVTLLFADSRRITNSFDENSRLRFEVEDLAHELELARDEALRKRFEAEAANASKTAFLHNMSHELRTPLNAILGFSEIIAKETFGPVGSRRYPEYARDIHGSGTHLLSLINDLLDVAKIEAGRMDIEPRVLNARAIFEAALKIAATRARQRNQRLSISVNANAPDLVADERALKQILINLVANAVKFTPTGGSITVTGSRAAGGGFQITVEDNGPGIPPDKLDGIFSPFSQVDNRYDRGGNGTGLGLALVRGLAELHGARAWIESEPGQGCRACVVFPARPDLREQKEMAPAHAHISLRAIASQSSYSVQRA
ncbi:MAG: HAMP domain-containing histidine kinase [Alphaproteobacteria bacterium]|nr:HAMP domain-containing histidine kinase [Alphaproteobacteria bacterium]